MFWDDFLVLTQKIHTVERCGAKNATILAAGRRGIRSENTNRVKWVVRREAACGADWRRMGKKNFTRVRVKFKTRREGDSNPRYPFEAHSISNRARSTNSVISPCSYPFGLEAKPSKLARGVLPVCSYRVCSVLCFGTIQTDIILPIIRFFIGNAIKIFLFFLIRFLFCFKLRLTAICR